MKVLVTGHQGYLGSVLVPTLLAKGHNVIGLDIGWFEGCDFISSQSDIVSHRIDFGELKPVDLKRYDAVIHLAGLSDDRVANLNESLTRDINEHAAIRLATQCKAAGVSTFIFASSCSVYGAAGNQILSERSPLNPVSTYAKAKLAVEQALQPMADQTFCPVSLRIGTVYGVSPRLRIDTVVNEFVASAIAHKRINMQTIGLSWRPFVHIEDVAHAIASLLSVSAQNLSGETYNLVHNDDNCRIRDLAALVCDTLPNCQWKASIDNRDERSYRVDNSKLIAQLPDFQFDWTLEKGINELALAMERYAMTPAQFRSDRYRRADRLQRLQEIGELDAALRWTQRHHFTLAG